MFQDRTFRSELGSYEILVLNDFTNRQPLTELVSGVSESQVRDALAEYELPTEAALLDTNIMLINTGEIMVLIDTGWGSQGSLLRILEEEGVARSEINLIIITHTDSDHTGGLLDEHGAISFPNAEYVVTRPAWNRWISDDYLRQLPTHQAEFVKQVTEIVQDDMRLQEVDDIVVPGVKLTDAAGHRQGHVAVEISSDGEKMLHAADAILSPIFVTHPTWHSPIDSRPAEAAQTRQSLLTQVAKDNLLLASAHLPFPGLCHVKAGRNGWLWQPIT